MKKHSTCAAPPIRPSRITTFFSLLIPCLDDIRDRAPLAPPIVAAWIVTATAAFAMRPLLNAAVQQDDATAAVVEFAFWATTFFAPVIFSAKAGLLATFTWALLELLDLGRVRFRQLMSIFLYGEAIVALRHVFGALYLHVAGNAGGFDGENSIAAFGLASLVPSTRPALLAATQSISLAHLAWVAFVSLALGNMSLVRLRSAVAVAATLWAAVVAVAAFRAALLT